MNCYLMDQTCWMRVMSCCWVLVVCEDRSYFYLSLVFRRIVFSDIFFESDLFYNEIVYFLIEMDLF